MERFDREDTDYYFLLARYNIRKYRLEKGITSQQLADASGLTHQYIRNLECLKLVIRPRIDTLAIIAKALNIDFIKLFDDSEN